MYPQMGPISSLETFGPTTDARPALEAALQAIEERIGAFEPRPYHLVPDFLVYCLASDVVEQCRATLLLVDSSVPRAAYATARAAIEAAQDLALLVSEPAEYDKTGARVYGWEMLETEGLQARFVRGRKAMGVPIPSDLGMTVREAVARLTAKWRGYNNQADALLQGALTDLRQRRPRGHWSGLSRNEIGRRLFKGTGYEAVADAMDALYGALSVQTHPRIREWTRKFSFVEQRVKPHENPEDRARPVDAAWAAAYSTWMALELSRMSFHIR